MAGAGRASSAVTRAASAASSAATGADFAPHGSNGAMAGAQNGDAPLRQSPIPAAPRATTQLDGMSRRPACGSQPRRRSRAGFRRSRPAAVRPPLYCDPWGAGHRVLRTSYRSPGSVRPPLGEETVERHEQRPLFRPVGDASLPPRQRAERGIGRCADRQSRHRPAAARHPAIIRQPRKDCSRARREEQREIDRARAYRISRGRAQRRDRPAS